MPGNNGRCDENIGKSFKSLYVRLHTGNTCRCAKNVGKAIKSLCVRLHKGMHVGMPKRIQALQVT